jgi:hypothetical protein
MRPSYEGSRHVPLVRVNDERHSTRELAEQDMRSIISRGFYWTRNEEPPDFPPHTPIVAVGSYRGRGLFLHGIVASTWEPLRAADAPYRFRVPVAWDGTIYRGNPDVILEGLTYNPRSWSRLDQREYATLLNRLLR